MQSRILISGAGIAGPTLAYWLQAYGFEPVLIEKAPKPRTGGYVIDFWGAGFDVAQRMALSQELMRLGYHVQDVKAVNRGGRRISGFSIESFAELTDGRFVTIQRSVLADLLLSLLSDRVEIIFADNIRALTQRVGSVHVSFAKGADREFDLVIGADGLHSRVRELAFGPQERFEQYLGYKVAAFETIGYPHRDDLAYVMFTEVGQQISRFTMRDDRTLFLFIFADSEQDIPTEPHRQKAQIRRRFGNSGWECPQILEAMDQCDSLYFDRVSQIRMSPALGLWSKGRVSLVGDAAFCVSLLAGQGAALAMVAAYILAGELYRNRGDYTAAFAKYQELIGPFVAHKQAAAMRLAGAFAPRTATGLFLRNQIFKLLSIPLVADWVVGRDLADKILLPDYRRE